ncbi:RNA degradosome polyphosphate kinase [uncultured Acetobacteroides sp.]|uniref:RNA degradosome polyphosphate kinase n=1 Tax=uncultured Acetobacteroides sp. TaxID=1760811 RepID=UPI0029F46812|nr:RNA degradosome polyphosphate kinase [uncultured Acetobacteroides sp.]
MADKVLKNINREVSWLAFDQRVLQEAQDRTVPLIERVRFLGIFSNNMDEFFRVRVATLRRLTEFEKKTKDYYGESPRKTLSRISELTKQSQEKFEEIFNELTAELRTHNVYLINEGDLSPEQHTYVKDFFRTNIRYLLSPIMLNHVDRIPQLNDKSIYLAIKCSNEEHPKKDFALIEIPSDASRFVVLPDHNTKKFVILLDDVIRANLAEVFKILPYDKFEAYTIKITRDAEMDVDNDLTESLLEKVSKGIKNRKKGEPVRLVYDREIPRDLLKFLTNKLGVDRGDTLIAGGRYHNFKDFMSFPNLLGDEFVNPPLPPLNVRTFDKCQSMTEEIEKKDRFLHYPFQDFAYFIRLLREAALDPDVVSIKVSLYRVAFESKVVRALINAAENGKKVTAMVELRARFDEKSNIYWSQRMEEVGINVLFGQPGFKVHSKILLITKKSGKKTTRIAAISTGNFHEGNAALYTDFTLLTAQKDITLEIDHAFRFIESPYYTHSYKHLLVSPHGMRKKLVCLINEEIKNAKSGKEGFIFCKVNNLVDEGIVDKLYEASCAGVKIKLIVRSMCSLIPGIPGKSENIEITSIVDRFLEHSRIFIFGNDGDPKYYISSADWMTRNLDFRVEVAAPIYDKDIQRELRNIMEYTLRDNQKSRVVDANLKNEYRTEPNAPQFRSQIELYRYYSQLEY